MYYSEHHSHLLRDNREIYCHYYVYLLWGNAVCRLKCSKWFEYNQLQPCTKFIFFTLFSPIIPYG